MIVSTQAITIGALKYGDTSKIVHFFTKEFGKISALAKGARNSKSKYGSCLEPLSHSELTIYKKSQTTLHLLNAAETIKYYKNLSVDYDCIAIGLMMGEAINYTHTDGIPDPELFDYLVACLEVINDNPDCAYSVFTAFMFKLAEQLGFYLSFNFMTDDLPENTQLKFRFSIATGCPAVQNALPNTCFYFDFTTIKLLEKIFKQNLQEIGNISVDVKSRIQIQEFFVRYYSWHLERNFILKSWNLLIV